MKLYRVQFDGMHYYIEAENFSAAIALWHEHAKALWHDDYDGTEQPESVELVHDAPVIREDTNTSNAIRGLRV